MKIGETIKRVLQSIAAILLPLIVLLLFPEQAKELLHNLQTSVGPTMPFLAILSFYAIAGLQMALKKQTDYRDIPGILAHTENIAALIIPIGMIGTYYALVEVLNSEDIDFSAHMHAMTSTLIALVIYVTVLICSEFITRIKNLSAETAEPIHTAITSKNKLTIQQIETAGFTMGICLFFYLVLIKLGVL